MHFDRLLVRALVEVMISYRRNDARIDIHVRTGKPLASRDVSSECVIVDFVFLILKR